MKGSFSEPQSHNKVVIEVDIEPSHSYSKGETFQAGFKDLGRGIKEETVDIRHGDTTEMRDHVKNLPKLDEERKRREQAKNPRSEDQISVRHLSTKLKRLLCSNRKKLDSSIYPILVLTKPDASMNQGMLDETFRFVQKIKWLSVFDFDDHGSDSKGLCKVFKSGPDTSQCDIHDAEDYDEDDNVIEDIYSTRLIGYLEMVMQSW